MQNLIKILVLISLMMGSNTLQAKLLMQGGYSHEFITTPGGVYKKSIKLTNIGKTPIELKLYLEDYLFNAQGTSSFTPAHLHKNPRSNSSWIRFNPSHIVLAAGMQKTVNYTLRVPNTPLSGTYWSALIVEPIPPHSAQSIQATRNDKKVHINIQQVSRHAIQIVAQMGETGRVNLTLKNPKMNRHGSKRTFSLDAYNFGNRWIKPDVWMDIHDQQGNFMGKFSANKARIYPRTSVRFPINISSLKQGKYKGLFVIDGGNDNDIMATDVNLTIQ